MPQAVYFLCALTSLACAILLARAWRATHVKLLMWSTLCFALLTLSNVLLFIDLAILPPQIDLQVFRNSLTLLGLTAMIHGLISEQK